MHNLKLKLIASAAALMMGSTAMANTSLDGTTAGTLFLNVVDTVSHTSFVFDTGLTQATFSSTGNYSLNFAADANWQSFLTSSTGHALEFSVVATSVPGTNQATVFFTANTAPTATVGANITQVQGATAGFVTGANGTTSATTTSAFLNTATTSWDNPTQEGIVNTNLFGTAGSVGAAPGTALAFYSETTVNGRSTTIAATLATFAGTFSLNTGTGVLSYSAVPLPTPLLLLLSGLGLMALVSRRRKSDAVGFAGAAA
jgi:hypothetical protein